MKNLGATLLVSGLTGYAIALFGQAYQVPYWLVLISCVISGCVLAYVHVNQRFKDDK